MSLGRKVLNRIDVQNDPVNWIDPWGLISGGRGGGYLHRIEPIKKHAPQTSCPARKEDAAAHHKLAEYAPAGNERRKWGEDNFHCGFKCYIESNVAKGYQQQECCYDECGDLVTDNHPRSGCKGTPNSYDGDTAPIDHALKDPGGIVNSGPVGWGESH